MDPRKKIFSEKVDELSTTASLKYTFKNNKITEVIKFKEEEIDFTTQKKFL